MATSLTKSADQLLEIGVISREAHSRTTRHFQEHGGYVEESLLEVRAMDEGTMLKALASLYKTRYVSTAKLRQAEIGRDVLVRVPAKIAEQRMVFPVLYEEDTSTLSAVCIDPSDLMLEQELTRYAGVRAVRLLVARPAAIRAAIQKFYKGDIHAFAQLDKDSVKALHSMLDVYERNVIDAPAPARSTSSSAEISQIERVLTAEDIEASSVRALPDEVRAIADGMKTVIQVLQVMVSLLETNRGELAGHSMQVAKLTTRLCERMGVSEHEHHCAVIGALIHDLGKGSPYHLTPFNVAEWDGHRTAAQKRLENPLHIFEAARLPEAAILAVRHMYERHDGKGLPAGLSGKNIPLAARIIGLADTFADLTGNSRNPYRRILSVGEALKVIARGKGSVFDPNLVDLFSLVAAGDSIKNQLSGASSVLIVEPDPEAGAILELQLLSRGFRVFSARTADQAVKLAAEGQPDLIMSEVELSPFNGFELKKRLDATAAASIPFVYYTSRAGAGDAELGFKLGAQDYVVKPSSVEILVAKLQNLVGRKPATAGAPGVSGSLSEMSLPDLVQILAHGRKTGQLRISSGQHRGEINFNKGEVYGCYLDGNLRGEKAFVAMLRFKEGSFCLDTTKRIEQRDINMSAEMLLLEGLRILDEEGAASDRP
jgi:response regulator RpfG family c-di-GMP phosphodiesterase